MTSDFEVGHGIYIVQGNYKLDLHNNFAFLEVQYSVADRKASLYWRRRSDNWVPPESPAMLSITFEEVKEFRFLRRDPEMPFTEDDCLSTMGYLTDEPWSQGHVLLTADPERDWLTAFEFQSGAVIALRADRASARIGSESEVLGTPDSPPRAT
jgi:hypothetical protein